MTTIETLPTTNSNKNLSQNNQEETSKMFFPRYFELEEFLPDSKNLLTEYLCSLCNGVYHEPYIISCGHIYCKSCIITQTDLFEVCPICSQKIEKEKVVNVQFLKLLIDKQSIYCKKRIKGCEWSGALMHLKEHMDKVCEFRSLDCTNSECKFSAEKSELILHKEICPHKKFVCEFCLLSFKILEKQKHEDECYMKIFACPNACGLELRRNGMQKHLDAECAEAILKCEFSYAGCCEEFRRKEKHNHQIEFCEKHLSLLSAEFIKLKESYELKCKEEEIKNKIYKNSEFEMKEEATEAANNDNKNPKNYSNVNAQVSNCNNYSGNNNNNNNFDIKGKSLGFNSSRNENGHEGYLANRNFANRKNIVNEKLVDEKANIFNMKEIFPSNDSNHSHNNSKQANNLSATNSFNNSNNKSATNISNNYGKNVKNFSVEKNEGKHLRDLNEKRQKATIPTFDLESSEDEKCSINNMKAKNFKGEIDSYAKFRNQKNEFKKNYNSKIQKKANEENSSAESDYDKALTVNNEIKENRDFEEGLDKDDCLAAAIKQKEVENDYGKFLNKKRPKENKILNEKPSQLVDEDMHLESIKKRKNEAEENLDQKINSNISNKYNSSKNEPESFQLEPETEVINPYFDMKYISEGLEVCDNKVTDKSIIKPIPYHKFAFIRLNLSEADESWKIQLDTKSNWISVGVCIKELVVKNNYKFTNSLSDPKFPLSFFGLSSNGFTWNKNVPAENSKKKEGLKLSGSQVIKVFYDAANLTLTFKVDNCSFTLTKVFADEYTQLVPCVIFSKNGDSAAYFKS